MKILGLSLLLAAATFGTTQSYANEVDCGYAHGLAIAATAMTAYGTSDLYFTSTDHSGGIYGTKQRQVDKFADLIIADSNNHPQLGKSVADEATRLKNRIYRVWVDDVGVYKKGIDSIDSGLNSFAHALDLLCQ